MFFISALVLLFILKTRFPSNRPISDILYWINIIYLYNFVTNFSKLKSLFSVNEWRYSYNYLFSLRRSTTRNTSVSMWKTSPGWGLTIYGKLWHGLGCAQCIDELESCLCLLCHIESGLLRLIGCRIVCCPLLLLNQCLLLLWKDVYRLRSWGSSSTASGSSDPVGDGWPELQIGR